MYRGFIFIWHGKCAPHKISKPLSDKDLRRKKGPPRRRPKPLPAKDLRRFKKPHPAQDGMRNPHHRIMRQQQGQVLQPCEQRAILPLGGCGQIHR